MRVDDGGRWWTRVDGGDALYQFILLTVNFQ